jgi:DNA polymerase type B, organellar and viral
MRKVANVVSATGPIHPKKERTGKGLQVRKVVQFLAWDGEGITDQTHERQRYVLFGHSGGGFVRSRDLTTCQCLDLLLDAKEQYPHHTFVGFATNYDVNMIVRDMSTYHVSRLWKTGKVTWNGYHLKYIPGKMFNVSRKGRKAACLYDVFTFFGQSFVRSLESFGIGTDSVLAEIEHGKARRGTFQDSELDTLVVPYWRSELRLLVQLCDALKQSLTAANIYLRDWYGPGAVANQLLNRHHIKERQSAFSPEIVAASVNAYAGGRFEQFKLGRYVGKVYQYDIRSAYPSSIVRLPSLANAEWVYHRGECTLPRFYDLCHVHLPRREWNGESNQPAPFHWRFPNGNVAYPHHLDGGWHFGSLVTVARQNGVELEVSEWYELQYDGVRPFEFVGEMYDQRARWKAEGNPAQYAAKIALNSLYGKFAQQVGAQDGKIPKFHQLEWAGMVTAQTRARIYSAMMQAPDHVIACETDSVFSTVPLDLPLGTELGEWELTEHDEIIYLQSGVYFTASQRHVHWKYRGMDRDGLSYDKVRAWLRDPSQTTLSVPMVRFMGMGGNLRNGKWCQWLPLVKTLDPLSLSSKRIHSVGNCSACMAGKSFDDGLHDLIVHPMAGAGESASHKLSWMTGEDYHPRRDEILGEE